MTIATIGIAPVLVVLFVLLFGWPLLRPLIATSLSSTLGQTATIGSLNRRGGTLLHPILVLANVHVAQPVWAGPGDIASVEQIAVQLPLLPLLTGHFRPESIVVTRPHLKLFRTSDGRLNWTARTRAARLPVLGKLRIADGLLEVVDVQADRNLRARFVLDGHGFRLTGHGRLGRQPLTLIGRGAPINPVQLAAPWPFRVILSTPRAVLALDGIADNLLNLDHFSACLISHGYDLHDLDKVVEAGLPGTQAFVLRAEVRHDAPDWILDRITGTLGRSDFAGRAALRQRNGRNVANAALVARQFDFRDLSSDHGQAINAAHFRRNGPRLLPETAIHLEHFRNVDATVRFVVHRLLFAKPSPFVSLAGTAVLDHGVLTIQPLVAGLVHGRITGSARVEHRTGQPHLMLNLKLIDSRIENVLIKPAEAVGPLYGMIRLAGDGLTVRSAIGHANGTVAFIVKHGALLAKTGELIGQDAGGLLAGKGRVELRCAIGHFSVKNGIAMPTPLLIDTAVSQANASGSIDLSNERIALIVAGHRKQRSTVRLAGPLKVSGILSKPIFGISPAAKSPSGIFKTIGHALFGGGREQLVQDANCANLASRALE